MKTNYRIIDANLNRVAEGLRVIEDLLRFANKTAEDLEQIRGLRHAVRKNALPLKGECMAGRDAVADPGIAISQGSSIDGKRDSKDLLAANFKRVQEGLRTIEENLKVVNHYQLAKTYESLRFQAYTLEKRIFQLLPVSARRPFPKTDLYCLTAQEFSRGRDNTQVVSEMIDAGINIIQYREKQMSAAQMYDQCQQIRKMTREAGVTFIINDHIELALLCEADGVHIGQDDLPIEAVRKLVGNNMFIGVSTHSPEQAREAEQRGADYIGVGPIFQTFTKKDVCDPVGYDYLEHVVREVSLPFVAIGGIKEHNVGEIFSRGATCVAMVTEIVGAKQIGEKIASIRKTLGCISDEHCVNFSRG